LLPCILTYDQIIQIINDKEEFSFLEIQDKMNNDGFTIKTVMLAVWDYLTVSLDADGYFGQPVCNIVLQRYCKYPFLYYLIGSSG
jgi:hypothetical protein